MRRFVLLAAALACAGCLTDSQYRNWPGTDRDRDKVRQAIEPVMEPSFERHIKAGGSVADPLGSFSGHSAGNGEAYWGVSFTYRTSDGAARAVTPEEACRILIGVQADVLAAVKKTGVEVNWSPSVELGAGPNPEGKFEIRYLRKLRDGSGEVSGEVVGKLIPVKGTGEPTSQVRVDFKEWPCE